MESPGAQIPLETCLRRADSVVGCVEDASRPRDVLDLGGPTRNCIDDVLQDGKSRFLTFELLEFSCFGLAGTHPAPSLSTVGCIFASCVIFMYNGNPRATENRSVRLLHFASRDLLQASLGAKWGSQLFCFVSTVHIHITFREITLLKVFMRYHVTDRFLFFFLFQSSVSNP